jgi:hypothetical protein
MGERNLAKSFINLCENYLDLNSHVYNTDKKKIRFVISLIGGTAAEWRTAILDRLEETPVPTTDVKGKGTSTSTSDSTLSWNSYHLFKQKFLRELGEADSKGRAQNELRKLRVGNGVSVSDYVAKFQNLIRLAGITEHIAQIPFFQNGLPNSMVDDLL